MRKTNSAGETKASADGVDRPGALARWGFAPGLVALIVAVASSGALVAKHFFKTTLPGCGPKSACGELDAHPLGSLGGMVFTAARLARGEPAAKVLPHEAIWPVSFLGLSLFLAMLTAFVLVHFFGVGGRGLRTLARLAAVGSLVYLGAMIASGKFCVYCLAAHAGCLSFWLVMEFSMRRVPTAAPGVGAAPSRSSGAALRGGSLVRRALGSGVLAAAAAVFVVTSGALGVAESSREAEAAAKSQAALDDSLRDILNRSRPAQGSAAAPTPSPSPAAPLPGAAAEQTPPAPPAPPVTKPVVPAPGTGPGGFTGRWRFGPEQAAIRLVVYSSYQCRDCKRVEEEIFGFIEKNPQVTVSLTAKHFPMSKQCNPYITQDMHPNACWAARVAETAGALKGNDGFWAMHRWLFSVEGSFTDASLPQSLTALGYDNPQQFLTVMQSPATLALVQSDIEEAVQLGLYFTPLIFVNGVELRGWEVPGAVTRALQTLAAQNPPLPVADAKNDRPVLADAKVIDDWRLGRRVPQSPDDTVVRAIGAAAADAKARIVVWGDYQEANTRVVDAAIREAMKDRPWVRYTFRHFPTAADCNPQMQGRTIHPQGCLAARAAEAAGVVGGGVAYWAMHDWLMKNPDNLSEDRVRAGAQAIGLDAAAVIAKLNDPAVAAAINEDAVGASVLGVRSIPMIFLNDRMVMRWEQSGRPLMPTLLDEAAKEAAGAGK